MGRAKRDSLELILTARRGDMGTCDWSGGCRSNGLAFPSRFSDKWAAKRTELMCKINVDVLQEKNRLANVSKVHASKSGQNKQRQR